MNFLLNYYRYFLFFKQKKKNFLFFYLTTIIIEKLTTECLTFLYALSSRMLLCVVVVVLVILRFLFVVVVVKFSYTHTHVQTNIGDINNSIQSLLKLFCIHEKSDVLSMRSSWQLKSFCFYSYIYFVFSIKDRDGKGIYREIF